MSQTYLYNRYVLDFYNVFTDISLDTQNAPIDYQYIKYNFKYTIYRCFTDSV